MQTLTRLAIALTAVAAPIFAGALTLQIKAPTDREAREGNYVLTAHVMACRSPAKTVVSAFAEGILNGERKSIRLNVTPLAGPGEYGLVRQWPEEGSWAIKMVATNPDYPNYTTATLVPMHSGSPDLNAIEHFYRAPAEIDVAKALSHSSPVASAL